MCKVSKNINGLRNTFYAIFAAMNIYLHKTYSYFVKILLSSVLSFLLACQVLLAQTQNSADSTTLQAVVGADSLPLSAVPKPPTFPQVWMPLQDSIGVMAYTWHADSVNYRRLHFVDTLNHNSGLYSPFKALGHPYMNLGIVGSAAQSHLYAPQLSQGFNVGIHAFDAFLWQPSHFNIIKTKNPYTNLMYVMGSKNENALKVQHAQSFLSQRIGFQLDFILFDHLGAYTRQHSDVKNFKIGLHYHTANFRYHVAAYYYHSTLNLQENGGLVDNSSFEEGSQSNKEVIPINLNEAESKIKRGGVAVQQHFFLSKTPKDISHIPDTNEKDYGAYVVKHFKKPYVEPVSHMGKLSHLFNYQRDIMRYQDHDQLSALYAGVPYYYTEDSTRFFDSISLSKVQNELRYSNGDVTDKATHPRWLNFYAGLRLEHYDYKQATKTSALQKNIMAYALTGGLFLNFSQHLSLGAKTHYYVANYMGGNYLLNSYANVKWPRVQARFALLLSRDNAPWMMQSFASSRFTWQQALSAVDVQKISAELQIYSSRLQLHISNVNNYCYYDTAMLPQQHASMLQHILLRWDNTLTWRHWGLDMSAAYQLSSQSDVLRVPSLWGGLKLYFSHPLFQNKLHLEVGVENAYYTKYKADAWMPALRAFHLQDKQEIGGYLLSDVYVNAKVGKARLFLRYDHFNAAFMGNNYFSAVRYPAQQASFRFGVHWILFQ